MTDDISDTILNSGTFVKQMEETLVQTEAEVRQLARGKLSDDQETSILKAREVVQQFRPIPQVMWKIINYAIGRSGSIKTPPEGMLFGLQKIILALSKDPALGGGTPASTVKGVLENVTGDIISAVVIMHAVSRRLKSFPMEAVWGPILDDAVLRANVGFYIGAMCTDFGSGKAMLAGFAGRAGLATLIALGTEEQAGQAIMRLSSGHEIRKVALEIYKTDPILVSSMILSASGCGRDAVVGTASFALAPKEWSELSIHQKRWLAALKVTDEARMGDLDSIPEEMWAWIDYNDVGERAELKDIVENLKKKGHPWRWLMQ